MKFLVTASALLLGAALSFGQVTKSKDTYLLRMKYKQGVVWKYTVSTEVSGLSGMALAGKDGKLHFDGPLVEKITGVTGKLGTISATMGPFKINGGQQAEDANTASFQMDELGNIVGASSSGGAGVRYSKAPVKVGGTWSSVIALPGTMSGSGSAKTVFRFNGFKTVAKKKVGNLTMSITPFGVVKSGNGQAYVSAADGSLISMDLNLVVANPQGGADMKVSTKIRVSK